MTRRRWIADEAEGNRAALTGEHAAHLARVLRARPGQEFEISVEGRVRHGRVASVTETRVEFELGAEVSAGASLPITVLLAVFKFDRMEWAIEKLTELGVERIVPVVARRTDAHLAAGAAKRRERWERLARQASEQSRRSAPPAVAPVAKLKQALAAEAGARILLSEVETAVKLKQALASAQPGSPIALAVGPEGGWTEDELRLFREAGWVAASLGAAILRAETAAIAAMAIAASELSATRTADSSRRSE